MKWIEDENLGSSKSGKTWVWAIKAKEGGDLLGLVKWFGRWRKYCFYPQPDCIFEEDCLRDIAQFVSNATRLHRDKGRKCPQHGTVMEDGWCVNCIY